MEYIEYHRMLQGNNDNRKSNGFQQGCLDHKNDAKGNNDSDNVFHIIPLWTRESGSDKMCFSIVQDAACPALKLYQGNRVSKI